MHNIWPFLRFKIKDKIKADIKTDPSLAKKIGLDKVHNVRERVEILNKEALKYKPVYEKEFQSFLDGQLTIIRKKDKWECPEALLVQGVCTVEWNCTQSDWESFCGGQLKAATNVKEDDQAVFLISIVLLGSTITADIYSHFRLMRQVSVFWKCVLALQAIIAINVCSINALCAAGQTDPVDILMTTTGLLVLNELDDIVGYVFTKYAHIEGEDFVNEKLNDGVESQDESFAAVLSFPHFFFVGYYTAWIVGIVDWKHPLEGYDFLRYWNPYSIIFFPVVLCIAYVIYYKPWIKSKELDEGTVQLLDKE